MLTNIYTVELPVECFGFCSDNFEVSRWLEGGILGGLPYHPSTEGFGKTIALWVSAVMGASRLQVCVAPSNGWEK